MIRCDPCHRAVEEAQSDLYRKWPSAVQPVEEREATHVWLREGFDPVPLCAGHADVFRRFAGRVEEIGVGRNPGSVQVEICVCGHPKSMHREMPSDVLPPTVLGCTAVDENGNPCACGPGCIHEGFVEA